MPPYLGSSAQCTLIAAIGAVASASSPSRSGDETDTSTSGFQARSAARASGPFADRAV